MQPHQSSRIDVVDLKSQLVKRIGPERSKLYLYYLNRLLSQKLSKAEFDRLCSRVLGRENLPLHNQFIRSILKNACHAKTPPPVHEAGPTKSTIASDGSSSTLGDHHQQNGSLVPNPCAPIWSNGVVLPSSPRKGRSNVRDRKYKDRPSPLGPNGKVENATHLSTTTHDGAMKTALENGTLYPCDYRRPVQLNQGLAEQPDYGKSSMHSSIEASVTEYSKYYSESSFIEDSTFRSSLTAPLGIPFCSASVGGARKALPLAGTGDVVSLDTGGLPDTETLRRRMEQIALVQGLGGVSTECANTMNNMLDVYLKRLIRSCTELVGARSGSELNRQLAHKHQLQNSLINGIQPSNHLHMQSISGLQESSQDKARSREGESRQIQPCTMSLLDFKVAMEVNPQLLGEDWPIFLEKICMNSFKE